MRLAILSLILGCLAGCAGGNSQLATCQAEKEQLLATIRTQRDSNRELGEQIASLEGRLDQAEKALAQGPGAPRFSKAVEQPPASGKAASLSRPASLSWRSPEEKATASSALKVDRQAASEKLAELARLDERVKFDRSAGIARIEMPLVFQGPSATLTAEDKRQLDDVARLLKSKEAKELGLVVSGGSRTRAVGEERAKAVVDYLDRHGIARERLQMGPAKSGAGRLVMEIVGGDGPVAELPASGEARRR